MFLPKQVPMGNPVGRREGWKEMGTGGGSEGWKGGGGRGEGGGEG